MDEIIRQEIQREANRCPVQSIPWENIRNRALDNAISNTFFQRNAVIRRIGYGFAAAVVISGILVASSFISPVIAGALERIPVINAVFNFIEDKGIQNAIDKGFSTKMNRTATDKGIFVTITEVLYDQGRLNIGYTVTTSRSDLSPEDIPGDLIIPLGSPGMQFFADDKPIQNTKQTTSQKMGNGRVGLVEIYPRSNGDLPETFNLHIVIQQIGKQQGEWVFGPIPVSRKDTDTATRKFSLMKTETIGSTTITVKGVKITPLSTIIDYELAQPEYSNLGFYAEDDKGHLLGTGGSSLVNRQTKGNMIISNFQSLYESPESMPKYLVLITQKVGHDHTDSQLQKIKIPLE